MSLDSIVAGLSRDGGAGEFVVIGGMVGRRIVPGRPTPEITPERAALLQRANEFFERLRTNNAPEDFYSLLTICKLYLKAGKGRGLSEAEYDALKIEVGIFDIGRPPVDPQI